MRPSHNYKMSVVAAVISSGLLLAAFFDNAIAQETSKRKKFGSSLERLKWDRKKGAAVEKERKEADAGKKTALLGNEDAVRIVTSLAVFDLLVVDRHGVPISGLTKDDFVVAEDGVAQQVGTFALGNDVALPRSIVLIIDYSRSQQTYLQTSIAAAKVLVEQLGPKDQMAIVTDDVTLLLDFTQDKVKLKEGLDALLDRVLRKKKFGDSEQYSALLATLRELLVEADRPIVLLQTDGDQLGYLQTAGKKSHEWEEDRFTNFSFADVVATVQREQTTVYSIISGIRLLGLTPNEQFERGRQVLANLSAGRVSWSSFEGVQRQISQQEQQLAYERRVAELVQQQEALAKVALASGGWYGFLERPEQATTLYSQILNDINRRYVVGYYPTNESHDGSLRKVRFEVRGHPEYVIVGRRSYYAPAQ
jgi:VWFA-related protein